MSKKKFALLSAFLLSTVLYLGPATTEAKTPKEYQAIVQHLKTRYHAKKANLFVMWAARAMVSMIKPAGVKSFSLTVFQHLEFSKETVDREMETAMRRSYGPDWSEIVHVRSKEGQQAYLYMRDAGENVRVVLVTIDKENAAVIRATFSPDRVADFINDPKILGISLNDDKPAAQKPADMSKEPH
jgi:hypothetical protein